MNIIDSRLEFGLVLLVAVIHILSEFKLDCLLQFPYEEIYYWEGQRVEAAFQIVNICLLKEKSLDYRDFFVIRNF